MSLAWKNLGFRSTLALTGAVLYGGCTSDCGGSIERAGETVGASMLRLVVVPRTRITGNQTGAGEMACRTGDWEGGKGEVLLPQSTFNNL